MEEENALVREDFEDFKRNDREHICYILFSVKIIYIKIIMLKLFNP